MSRPPINLDLVRTRAADVRRELELLQEYAALPETEFTANVERVRAARYSLVVAVEAAAVICTHLSTRHGRAPESYPGCFEGLVSLGIIDDGLGERLASMARLRNILVHGYGRIDDGRFHAFLRQDLGDLTAFLDAVGVYVRAEAGADL